MDRYHSVNALKASNLTRRLPRIVLLSCLLLISDALFAQYPFVIEMFHMMIGNADIRAKHEIIHKPGFEAKAGLDYRAHIDPSFNGAGTPYASPAEPGFLTVDPSNRNYIITTTPQEEGYDPSAVSQIEYTCDQVWVDIMYYDGLGREEQQVSVMGSPDQRDFIKPFTYDALGRKDRDYLPYEHPENASGQFDEQYPENQQSFIGSQYGSEHQSAGYTGFGFEPSPLNRIVKTAPPGAEWALNASGTGHYLETSYTTNTVAIDSWKLSEDHIQEIQWPVASLYCQVDKNENRGDNRGMVAEYKDKLGRVVLKESYRGNEILRTHYVYDEYSLLRCVVPPGATSPAMSEMCYFYNYDKKRRLVEKKLPGAGWVRMIYDKRDRLVMTQDGLMHQNNARRWMLTCYDELNRAVYTGFYNHTTALIRENMQNHYDQSVTRLSEALTGNSNSANHGYTTRVVEALGGGTAAFTALSFSYYDDYTFAPDGYEFINEPGFPTLSEILSMPRGQVTGLKTRNLTDEPGAGSWMLTVNYYDDRYRVVQTVNDNPCPNGFDITTNQYSFTGRLLATRCNHRAFEKRVEFTERFRYDHRGRLLEHTLEGLPGEPEVMLGAMRYRPSGELKENLVHSEKSGTTQLPFIQKQDYSYTIRGWLSSFNDPANTATENDIFAQRLYYNETMEGIQNTPQYNGNISAIDWAMNTPGSRNGCSYGYDPLDRLTASAFHTRPGGGWQHDNSFDETGLSYDANGNLLTLSRYGASGIKIDELTYHYEIGSNRLDRITDALGDRPGLDYPGPMSSQKGFYYDANGNLTKYLDKGITTPIVYNHLNLPELIDFGEGEKIRYTWDASGARIGKTVMEGSNNTDASQINSGNFVYSLDGTLQYILTSQGRLVPDGTHFRFEYFMKDHLGNTRANYAPAAPGLPQVAEYHHYYPFGLQIEPLCYSSGADIPNNHLYNGKELQPDFGLQWYDYGARFYDPSIGRWTTIDYQAEKYSFISPYVYCINNPLKYVDPDGNEIKYIIRGSNDKIAQTYVYKNGGFYDKASGKKYDVATGKDFTLTRLAKAYGTIEKSDDKILKNQLHTLEKSDIVHWIEKSPNGENAVLGVVPAKKIGSFSSQTEFTFNENNEKDDVGIVAHEMRHQFDDDIGNTSDNQKENTAEDPSEIRAVYNENRGRKLVGLKPLTTYRGDKIDPKLLANPPNNLNPGAE